MDLRKEIRKTIREQYNGNADFERVFQQIKKVIPDAVLNLPFCELSNGQIKINIYTRAVSPSDYGPMRHAQGGIVLARKIRTIFPEYKTSVTYSEAGMQKNDVSNIDIELKHEGH